MVTLPTFSEDEPDDVPLTIRDWVCDKGKDILWLGFLLTLFVLLITVSVAGEVEAGDDDVLDLVEVVEAGLNGCEEDIMEWLLLDEEIFISSLGTFLALFRHSSGFSEPVATLWTSLSFDKLFEMTLLVSQLFSSDSDSITELFIFVSFLVIELFLRFLLLVIDIEELSLDSVICNDSSCWFITVRVSLESLSPELKY